MRWVAAVVLQGLLFGAAHVGTADGVGNIGLAVVLAGVGVVFGGAAYLLRRIGPTILAHAIFNGVVLIIVLTVDLPRRTAGPRGRHARRRHRGGARGSRAPGRRVVVVLGLSRE